MRWFRAVGLVALFLGALGAYALAIAPFLDPTALSAADPSSWGTIGTGLLFAGLVGGPVRPLTYQMLAALGSPQTGGQPQALRWIYFDTDTVTSTVTRSITFFTTARGNKQLTNLETPGQMNAGNFFEICYLGFDILVGASETAAATAASGSLQDIQQIMLVNAPTFNIDYNGKNYGEFPLRFLHTSGGAQGAIASGATAPDLQVGNNSFPDGGWNWGGGLILCPGVGFSVTVTWNAIPTITQGPVKVSFWMEGVKSRPVS